MKFNDRYVGKTEISMKIKVKTKSYNEVIKIKRPKHLKPLKQSYACRLLLKLASLPELYSTKFKCEKTGMERLKKDEPALFLMNHSSFIDLKIASSLLFPRPFNIVCTSDGFVGKNSLMRFLGCIPTKKFLFDISLVLDIKHAVNKLHSSILMYPEASYTFDGCATPLPDSVGPLIKSLGIPVVMISTYGAFARQPLYNNLKTRKVQVSAKMEYLLSPEDISKYDEKKINDIVNEKFKFDGFKYQQSNKIKIDTPDRAEGLHRVLYKCPDCMSEGTTESNGEKLTCKNCGKSYILDEYGYMKAEGGITEFSHIPDWYAWQRKCVKQQLEQGTYLMDTEVEIYMLVDTECIYKVGCGHLTHSPSGFHLTGCDGELDFTQKPIASYSLYSDFFWYELGDIICIGNQKALYYCFPKDSNGIVAKARLATEELYKLSRHKSRVTP